MLFRSFRLAADAAYPLNAPVKGVLRIQVQISKAGGNHHPLASQLHRRFNVAVEELHRALPVDLIRVGNTDGVDALFRGEAGQLQVVGLDFFVQLHQTVVIKILQVQMGAGGPQLNGAVAQALGRIQEVIQGVPLVMVVGSAKLFNRKHPASPLQI